MTQISADFLLEIVEMTLATVLRNATQVKKSAKGAEKRRGGEAPLA